ncbi:hypothetical protein PPYR_02279 [Photinus pyralis]|uniref:Putative nuclease HARBI1 n=1 Tax=Photinus pyralis TaxID=7054 RepID=A0A5N4B6T4_PHOPY|nr:hypothetical protein PPYR_02279 [Photinus pyralis]
MDEDFRDLFSSSDEELLGVEVHRPYTIRERNHHFDDWDDVDFFRRFRLSKQSVEVVLNLIQNQIQHRTNRNHAISPMNQLLIALRFYAVGNPYAAAGDFGGVHKSTAGVIIKRVTTAISTLRRQFVSLPTTPDEVTSTQEGFYNIARFPRVLGAIDCTHVRIKSPGGERAENFRNRKGYFSLNVQVVADSKLRITDIVARWPGSSHDSTIFHNSRLKYRLESGEFRDGLLLGDSGYGVKRYLIPPLANPGNASEHLFNESQIRTRNVVERTFGVWKKRFPILSIGMEQSLPLVQDIIVTTAILHNIACDNGELLEDDLEQIENEQNNGLNNFGALDVGDNAVRNALIYDYFARLL